MKRLLSRLSFALLVLTIGACASEPVAEPEDTGGPAAEAQPEGPTRSIVNITGDLYRAQNNQHHTAFLVTDEGIIMSDPINRDFAMWLRGELAERFDQPVRYVLYSHSDWDHASGGEVFADTAEFVGHENMQVALAEPTADTPLPPAAAELDANGNGTIEESEASGTFQSNFTLFDADENGMLNGGEIVRGPVSDVYPPTDTYSDTTAVTLGGKTVEMFHPGPAHSRNMSVIHFPEERAVFVVDYISLGRVPFQTMAGYDLDVWMDELQDIASMDLDFVIPAHGVVGTPADVGELRQYLAELRDAVNEGMANGASLEDMQASITMEAYSDWANYEQWLPLNVEGMYNMLTP